MAESFDEMAACRNAIDRMDQLLEDLRKYGFSLITALLTASGIAAGVTHTGSVLPVAAVTTMFLVIALFGIDMYYHVILSAAVERSMDLEVASAPPVVRVTTTISANAIATHSVSAVFGLYSILLGVATGIGFIGGDTTAHIVLPIVALAIWATMTGYWLFIRRVTKLHQTRPRVHPSTLAAGRPNTLDITGSGFLPWRTTVYCDIPGAVAERPTDMSTTSMRVVIVIPNDVSTDRRYEINLHPVAPGKLSTISVAVDKEPAQPARQRQPRRASQAIIAEVSEEFD